MGVFSNTIKQQLWLFGSRVSPTAEHSYQIIEMYFSTLFNKPTVTLIVFPHKDSLDADKY